LLDHLRATYSPQSTVRYDKRFEEISEAPFLVLDGLGTESATPWAREKLYQVFNHRYVARLPTVITTTWQVEEIDPMLRTRVLDSTRCIVFAILAPDYNGGKPATAGAPQIDQTDKPTKGGRKASSYRRRY
jgi:DNA replication protein DnaC